MGEIRPTNAYLGLNLDSIIEQVKPGQLTFAQNAQVAGFEGNSITYQNEQSNDFCFTIPEGYKVIGDHQIIEISTVIYWLANATTGQSEIGKVVNDSCIYETVINANCLNLNIDHPILKAVHKITNCTVEVYWTDGFNPRRWIDLNNLPFTTMVDNTDPDHPCTTNTTNVVDCNKLSVQPNFDIPQISYVTVADDGNTLAGTYQFAVQYCNSLGDPYTAFYSVTDPIPVHDPLIVIPDFNYPTGKSIQIEVSNLDTTGIFQYFNVAVVKTINNISSVDLVATYQIQGSEQKILYTGQSKAGITLTINDIFEKFDIYDTAGDITTAQDILIWDDLTATERVTYQLVANQIHLQWVSYKLPPVLNQFKDELNVADFRGYMRDEVYAFDMVVVLKNGYQSDRFPIPGRIATAFDLEPINNGDTDFGSSICETPQSKPRWEVYNTASITNLDPQFLANENDPCYQGPYQVGEFSYWESTETYPCNDLVWGPLSGQNIRHHKFPDSAVTHHYDDTGNVYPLGIRVDMMQVYNLFRTSGLSTIELDRIAEIKIVRGNRANAKSVIAKGLLYNVGLYSRDNSNYFYPNYPFNDLRPDPFIQNEVSYSAGILLSSRNDEVDSVAGPLAPMYTDAIAGGTFVNIGDVVTADYQGTFSNNPSLKALAIRFAGQTVFDSGPLNVNASTSWEIVVSITMDSPTSVDVSTTLTLFGTTSNTTTQKHTLLNVVLSQDQPLILYGGSFVNISPPAQSQNADVVARFGTISYKADLSGSTNSPYLTGFGSDLSKQRFTFHSPDTAFYQPFLGNILKLETIEYGTAKQHFVQVKDHAKYKFPSLNSYLTALTVGIVIGFASGTYGLSNNVFNGNAAFTAFSAMKDIIYQLIPRKNFAFQFNSLGQYTNFSVIPNDNGNKIRQIDIGTYLASVVQGVSDTYPVNNWERETSVYLRTTTLLPYADTYAGVPQDKSRFVASQVGCPSTQFFNNSISSYYGSIKTLFPDQYGQIYSYSAVDTGFSYLIDLSVNFNASKRYLDVFGGDTFINKFAFKRKLPFFIDNRVGNVDDSDVFYDELGNIGNPTYWFSTDIQRGSGGSFGIGQLFGVKVNNFDCKGHNFFYDSGKIYLFAYGIPYFYVESTVNIDYRQAYNNKEGDYYPHVSGDVPDDWLQEVNVPIIFDNTYTYNKTFSKQNIENNFTTLPIDFIPNEQCQEVFHNRAVYSDKQEDVIYYKKNNWLIYRPANRYDFPLNYGKLTSLEGIENRAVLARFENKSMIYNALVTIDTSNPQAAYVGQGTLFSSTPPIDFVETDLGYTGSQHKFFLKTEFGNISIDAKRGNVFIISGNRAEDIGQNGLDRFFEVNLKFQMGISFPDYNIDNHFKGVGLHGVYDEKYKRFIITKLDYLPLDPNIIYNSATDSFTLNGVTIELGDPIYFCNISWTLSYWFQTKSWISFHSYRPNFYVGAIGQFYTGRNDIGEVWRHNTDNTGYNSFYGNTEAYILEYPYSYKFQDEIIQSIKDYTKVNRITDAQTFVQTNENYFNKAIIYNDQQCSGVMELVNKPKNNLSIYLTYPKYNTDSRSILFVKSDNFYNYNGIWDIVTDYNLPFWKSTCSNSFTDKQLDPTNLDYGQRSFKKYPLRAKDSRVRHILDNTSQYRLTSQFIAQETTPSYK